MRLFRGHPCRYYTRHRSSIEQIFLSAFPAWSPTSHRTIEQTTGIPHQRLYSWKRHWDVDPNWRPWKLEARGDHHRIFTVAEEQAISDHIMDTYLTPGLLFTDATFSEIAIQAFLEKYRDADPPVQFQCSAGFTNDFKKRNRFSSRRAHLKRRPVVSDEDRAQWTTMLAQLIRDVADHQRIINVDELCWWVHPDGLQTWAATGSENIHLVIHGSEKDSFTVVAAITAARTKLPLTLIASGKTASVEANHFGDVGYHRTDHSESGWTTAETFRRWLAWLRGIYDDAAPLWLVLDCYAVHRQQSMKNFAAELGIHLLFIPPGLTDELQPLDRFVFGVMKAHGRRMYRVHAAAIEPTNKPMAAAFLIRAWEAVSTAVLEDPWAPYEEANEREE
jgi:hypothetical protein